MDVPDDWMANEKGNTWLCDDDGNHVAWLRLGDRMLELTVTPGNSPGLFARVLDREESSPESIAKHINDNLSGWTVRRCNIEGVRVEQNTVA